MKKESQISTRERNERHELSIGAPVIRKAAVFAVFLVMLLPAAAIGGVPAAAAPSAPAETTDVATFYATADSYVSQSAPNDNYGNLSYFYVRRDAEGDEDHALIAFDTSTLPDNIVVVSATLRLYSEINLRQPNAPADVLPVQPEAALSSWTETGVTWNNRPASSDLGDPAVNYQVGWQHFDVTNIVQGWVDGSVTNYGMVLTPGARVEGWAFYWDRSHDTAGPRLTVEYEDAPPPSCETALADLSLSGPTSGATGRTYTFGAVASPTDADTPIAFAWEATDQTPVEESGSETASEISWSWDTVGSKQITVTAENCGASFVRHQTIDVVTPSTLPDLVPGEPWYDAYQGNLGWIVRNDGLNAAPSSTTAMP